jgi:hypothetical protein
LDGGFPLVYKPAVRIPLLQSFTLNITSGIHVDPYVFANLRS